MSAAAQDGGQPRQTLTVFDAVSMIVGIVIGVGIFKAPSIVAGNVSGETTTAPVLVQQKYQNFEQETAYTVSFLLAFVSVLCIIVVSLLRPKEES